MLCCAIEIFLTNLNGGCQIFVNFTEECKAIFDNAYSLSKCSSNVKYLPLFSAFLSV